MLITIWLIHYSEWGTEPDYYLENPIISESIHCRKWLRGVETAICESEFNRIVKENEFSKKDLAKALYDYGDVHREILARSQEKKAYYDLVEKLK